MSYRRLIVALLILGFFVFLAGCASHRPRVMRDSGAYSAPSLAPSSGSANLKGGLARVRVHGRGHGPDCWDIFVMVVLFTWLFGD
ncbi:MAG: hypothetical protein E3J72_22510 [Planctomycetota bacterium]|nr:MAG: hypothetical protein E3J72_22510 [Planctomycetota bacterium]